MGPIFGKLKKFGVWAPGTHDDNRPFLRIKNHRILMTSIIIMTHAANARRCKLGFVGPNMEIVLFGLHQANKKGPFSMEPIPRVKDPKRCGSFGRNHSCDKSTKLRRSRLRNRHGADTWQFCLYKDRAPPKPGFGMLGNPSKVGNPGHFLDVKLPHLKDQQRLPRAPLPRILHRPGLSLFLFPGGKQKCLGGQLPNMSIARFGMGQKWVCTQAQAGLNQQKDVGVQPIKTTRVTRVTRGW